MSIVMENCSIDATDVTGKTALWRAIERGNAEDFKRILKSGADVNKTYYSRQTPLMLAVEKGHAEYLQALFNAGANIDSVNSFGMSSVMIAAQKGHLDCLRVLVDAGASLLFRDIRGRSALLIAVEENSCECTRYLIEAGANVHQLDSEGTSALIVAIYLNCEKCLQILVQAGASVDEFSKSGKTPLMFAAVRTSYMLSLLIQLGANIDLSDGRGRTSTIHAASEGNRTILLKLVQAGANLNLADNHGQTAVMIAAEADHVRCVECLAYNGAKLDLQDSRGRTALMLAAAKGNHDVLLVLLQHGEQWKDLQCKSGRTALIYGVVGLHEEYTEQLDMSLIRMYRTNTVYKNLTTSACGFQSEVCSKCIHILLAAGANPNICDVSCMSPLMHAAMLDTSGELFQQLIEAGADINLTDKGHKRSALLHAASRGNTRCIKILVEAGAPVNIGSCDGETALYLAVKYSSSIISETVVFLLDHGADVNAQDKSGITPLMCAARCPNGINVMSYLISHGAEINKTDNTGRSALYYTISANDDLLENALFLLESGANPNIKSTRNGESTVSLAIRHQNISFLLLFIRNNSESQIEWEDFFYIMTVTDKRMLQVVVLESLLPSNTVSCVRRYDDSLSILKTALNLGRLGVAKYLLAIGYLNIFDIYSGKPKTAGNNSYWRRNPHQKEFFLSLYSQPWPLAKLAFVVVSSNMGTSPERKNHIRKSGLPNRLQKMLLFQEPISKLCTQHWDSIPICFDPEEYEKRPRPRPLLYYWPFGQDLAPCDCSECSHTGYKFV